MTAHHVDLSPPVADEVKTTTCYMCACRCGIKVHLKNGKIRYIQGNPEHPVNKGVLCAKGSAGIMQHYSPARLRKPLKRVGERGTGEFEEIEWEEALELATDWLQSVRQSDPRKLAFFTGRDQSQAMTGWWASQFGTPNYAAHGGFCSVNMAAGGIYTIGGSFWEFGEPDWDQSRYFMMFGVAEDHDSNPIKMGLSTLKGNGAKFVSVNPVRTGYSAIADEWLPVTPGTDGLLVMSLIHELLRAGKVDLDYLLRYTNSPWLVIQNPGGGDDGLFARNEDGKPLCWDRGRHDPVAADVTDRPFALTGEVTLPDGRKAVPSFQLLAERYGSDEYDPDAVADRCGIAADTIRRIAAELAHAAFEEEIVIDQKWTDWAGREHQQIIGRPVSIHAMRGISAHSNGFHTCRALHLLQVLLGSIDVPGGMRYKAPFPKHIPPMPRPAGKPNEVVAGTPMAGPPLGFPAGPEDLLVDPDGTPRRIDKAFSWDAPISVHGMMHTVITNAWAGDPYPIEVLFMYMSNMAWNSAMNTSTTMAMLTDKNPATGDYKIPKIIYSDAYASEMVAFADLVLPDTTYLERWDSISLLDRPISSAHAVADAIRQPVVQPDRDVRAFQDVMIDLGHRLGLPGMTLEDGGARYPGGYPDYLVHHERKPGIGSLAGWRNEDGSGQGRGAPNDDQLARYIENGCFWELHLAEDQLFYKHANRAYLDLAHSLGFIDSTAPIVMQLYSEEIQRFRLAAEGHGAVQPPADHRPRIKEYFDPLPIWYAPFEDDQIGVDEFPLHAITQRPAAMYHSWGSQNAWLRQIHTANRLYVPRKLAQAQDIADDDWVWLESRNGKIKAQVRLMDGVNENTVWTWNAIGKRKGAWALSDDAPESREGFLLNHLIDDLLPERESGYRYANADPVTGQAAWYDLRVKMRKAATTEKGVSSPQFDRQASPPGVGVKKATLSYGEDL